MFHDPDPFSDLFPTFFNPPTIVISIPDVFSGITAGLLPSTSSTQPPQTTQAPSTSSASSSQPTTPSEPSRPVRTPLDTARTSTHSPVSLPSSSSSSTVDATTVVFNVTNILTETSLLTAPASPSATAASLRSDVHTLPGGAIAGIVVAIVSGVLVLSLALLLLYRRRRTKQRQERAIPHPSSPLLFRCAGAQSPGPQPLRDKPPGTRPPAPLQIVESRAADTGPRESVVDMSYVSDDHLPLMNAGLSSPTTPRRVTCRERDGGRVHPSLYLDTSAEQYAGQSVEYLPPAYEDLPPSPMSPVTTTPMTHG
ncbi:hypothetical protein K466DRAFT_657353 [Polyporus arcularius HHB13444]|uniref:Uncharacterized protein n=1 Tax=Polyporus arcularius HHB13444 TaxID=1314778 RepID=A0A5C3PYV0_9APHY|nr:hypothetical protein K466DRAFT_657353 [Polyporus arcularius HHB13444]